MISACMAVSVRELRTAVREWACCSGLLFFQPSQFCGSVLLCGGPKQIYLLINPIEQFALVATLSTCVFQLRLLDIVNPKYLALLTTSRT